MINSPKSEADLLERCRGIAGRTLAELASRVGWHVPAEPRRAKGFTGQLLEECLGATAGSKSVPDFERLGVEMKSISEATEKSDKPKLSRKQRRRQNRGDVFDMVEGQFKEQHDE